MANQMGEASEGRASGKGKPLNSIDHKVDCVLSNSFGFGGTNASLIFKSI